jgi:hypothetical protein
MTTHGQQSLIAPQNDGERLQQMMLMAIEKGPEGVEMLRELVHLQQQIEDRQAARDFAAALSAFQHSCPEITRHKGIPGKDGKLRYRYAPLEDIVRIAGPHLHAQGLSWSFDVDLAADLTTISCTLHHVNGHSRTSSARVPGVTVPTANAAQNEIAGVTYGKRSAFLSVTGLTTADEDSDGRQPEVPDDTPVTPEQADYLRSLVAEAWPEPEDRAAWLARVKIAGEPITAYEQMPARFFKQATTTLEARLKFRAENPEATS